LARGLSPTRLKADGKLEGETKDDESKIADSALLSQVVDKVFKEKEPDVEQMLVSELKKFNIEPERKVPFKGPVPTRDLTILT